MVAISGNVVTGNSLSGVTTPFTFGPDGFNNFTSNGPDTITSGDGNDTVLAGGGDDQIYGDGGNDSLLGQDGTDEIYGGTGHDYINGGSALEIDNVYGGDGNDTIDYSPGNDNNSGDLGDDTFIVKGLGGGSYDGGDGIDTLDMRLLDVAVAAVAGPAIILGGGGSGISSFGNEVILLTAFDDAFSPHNVDSPSIYGGDGNDSLHGGSGNALLDGGAGNDLISGNYGSCVLAGGAGSDTLDYSGLGAVTINYDVATGIIEKVGFGTDTISGFETINFGTATVNYRFGGTSGNDTFTGDNGDNLVSGGAGNDTLSGAGGNDSIGGGANNDQLSGGAGNDTLDGGTGSDYLSDGEGNDSLLGNDGDDVLYAGAGNDVLDGGTGNDTINYNGQTGPITATFSATAGQGTVTGGGFTDLFYSIEGLVGTAAADTITGGTSALTITGGGGNDSITGSSADDLFIIGVVDGTDIIDGGAGTDTIRARTANTAVNWASTSNVEVFDSAGFANFRIKGTTAADTIDLSGLTLTGVERVDGGAGNDSITGSAGNDRLFGAAGNDSMDGGDGDDTFLIAFGNGTDSIIGGTGSDTIRAEGNSITIDWTRVSGVEAADGGAFANFRLAGTASANLLDFSGVTLTGVERIDGGGGNDSITGSAGDDRILGNAGADVLAGGAGADTFLYTLVTQSNAAATDRITDWDAADMIDLSAIDASTLAAGNQAFTWIGSGAFTNAAGQLRAFDDGANTFVQADTNGDGKADMVIRIDGPQVLTAADFAL